MNVNPEEDAVESLKSQCEASAEALQVGSLDVVLLTGWSEGNGEEEFRERQELSLEALVELQTQGMIQHIGLAGVTSVEQVKQSQKIANVSCVRQSCSIAQRMALANGILDHCDANNIAFLAEE